MNVALLEQLRDYVLKFPDKYNQLNWCGSECCLAGHAIVLTKKVPRRVVTAKGEGNFLKYKGQPMDEIAAEALGLTDHQRRILFLSWPDKYAAALRAASTKKAKAQVAADRINRFIESKGRY